MLGKVVQSFVQFLFSVILVLFKQFSLILLRWYEINKKNSEIEVSNQKLYF